MTEHMTDCIMITWLIVWWSHDWLCDGHMTDHKHWPFTTLHKITSSLALQTTCVPLLSFLCSAMCQSCVSHVSGVMCQVSAMCQVSDVMCQVSAMCQESDVMCQVSVMCQWIVSVMSVMSQSCYLSLNPDSKKNRRKLGLSCILSLLSANWQLIWWDWQPTK